MIFYQRVGSLVGKSVTALVGYLNDEISYSFKIVTVNCDGGAKSQMHSLFFVFFLITMDISCPPTHALRLLSKSGERRTNVAVVENCSLHI